MLQAVPANMFSARTGAEIKVITPHSGEFSFALWGRMVSLAYPALICIDLLTGQELPATSQALVLYYFITADGTPVDTQMISFADLPDGRFYNQAFQGYTGAELARVFRNDLLAFEIAAKRLGGIQPDKKSDVPGDLTFIFQVLPRLSLVVVYWLGDEDFPASAQVLFEISAPHYLPTDVCAYAGSTLTRKLIQQATLPV